MNIAWMLLAAAAGPIVAVPDGARVVASDRCFVSTMNDAAVGVTRQVIRADIVNGRKVWDVVIHQSVPGRQFDMRDHFVLDRRDLQPIALDNRRDGVEHVRLAYAPGRVTGTKTGKAGPEPVDVALRGPVWDGNLWGVTFGALPLKAGARFSVPFYQYDKGSGRFEVAVTGSETVPTSTGPVEAWTLDVDTGSRMKPTYLIAKRTGAELGYRAGPFAAHPGGDCSALD